MDDGWISVWLDNRWMINQWIDQYRQTEDGEMDGWTDGWMMDG